MIAPRSLIRFAVVALCAIVPTQAPPSHGQPALSSGDETWRVVVLNNADFLLPASAIMDQALRDTLTRESPRSVEFFGETLDSFRHPHGLDEELHALMRKKYERIKVDLVMARSKAAMDFVMRYGEELWPNAPVIFYNYFAESRNEIPNGHTGVLIELSPSGTIDLARRMHPRARAIYVVGGKSEYDRDWKRRIEPMLARLRPEYSVTWLDDLPLPRILDAVARLPIDSLVLYTSVMIDAEGQTRTNPQIARQVAAASAVPVYGFLDTYVGTGIAGGMITDFAGQGQAAARLALRVLGGESPGRIAVQPSPPAKCVVDARAMERFGINERLLPADCEVRYRPPSVWRDYRWYVVGAVVALALQSLLIATLFSQRRRRQNAEIATQQQRVELAHALRLATVGEMTAAISHEINQPLGAILGNAEAAEMLLESDKPEVDHLRKILADIRREDLRASEVVRRIRSLLQKHDFQKETFDVHDLIADTVRLVAAEAQRREVDIDVWPSPSPLPVHGDRIQLQQLLMNLIINAMDSMMQTPVVFRRVTLHAFPTDGRKIEIAVSDAGHGIQTESSDRLFDSFFTTKPKGLGLGLSIARTIAKSHGGAIRAANNPSVGATFSVTLPQAVSESAAQQMPSVDVLEEPVR